MNNYFRLDKSKLIILLILLSLFIFIGCQTNASQRLTDEEIHQMYQRASEIYAWFDIGTLPASIDTKVEIDGRMYFKVQSEFTSYEEFVHELRSYFDEPIVNELLSRDLYRDVDGELYGVLADRGTDIYKGDESYEIIRENEDIIIYQVSVEKLNEDSDVIGYETFEFPLKYHEDGQWRFTDFDMVR